MRLKKKSTLDYTYEDDSKPKTFGEIYRNGGEGFAKWSEDYVCIPIYPEGSDIPVWTSISDLDNEIHPITKRSYRSIWENQVQVSYEALEMTNGRFNHRLIVLCWPRGEGKSFLAVLFQLWKYFCWPRQQIMLGANSKEQTKFVHYDIMRDIIQHSPKLLRIVGRKNVQEKEIRLRDSSGNTGSVIRSISSFSGIVSNITGYTFSEMFDMKNPKFFVQLDGSIRNVPNALGVIDSTVSEKTHVLYKLYETYRKGGDPLLYFSHRFSKHGNYKDYWHPHMTQAQLESYRSKWPGAEFARYFQNTWEAGSQRMVTDAMIDAAHTMGCEGHILNGARVREVFDEQYRIKEEIVDVRNTAAHESKLKEIEGNLIPVSRYYTLSETYDRGKYASGVSLGKLSESLQTDWAVLAGIDRADPMKKSADGARTIITFTAKGLPGSKNRPEMMYEEGLVHRYVYLNLGLFVVESSELEDIKTVLKLGHDEFSGIDVLCGERWGLWDLAPWCEDQDILLEHIFPTYDKQKEAFSEWFILLRSCRFKTPEVEIHGSKTDRLLREEMEKFDNNPGKKWYGSPEKFETNGIQDDCMFSYAWNIYGGRTIGVDKFRERSGSVFFGIAAGNSDLHGRY